MNAIPGRQVWGDHCFRGELRIQQNVLTGQCRLLDRRNRRLACGTYAECLQKLDEQNNGAAADQWVTREAVILLHGILRTSRCFGPLQRDLDQAGYAVLPVDYPSTRMNMNRAAEQLDHVITSLANCQRIHLVGHSMGGLIIRNWFGQFYSPEAQQRIGRVVMLGTPNQGAELADMLRPFAPFRWLFGPAGLQLGTRAEIARQLPIPPVPFGIIAGGRGERTRGFNPLIPGDDDGTVTVASTHLAGEADFLRVPALHMQLMRNRTARKAVLQFLATGRFAETTASPRSE